MCTKAVHKYGPLPREVVPAYPTIALQPCRGLVVATATLKREQTERLTLVVFIREFCQLVIDTIDVAGIAIVSGVEVVRLPIGIQQPVIGIEGTVLLHHEDHMVDALYAARGYVTMDVAVAV